MGPIPRFVLAGLVAAAAVFILTAAVKKGVRPPSGSEDRLAFGYCTVGNFWNKIWNRQYIGDQNGDTNGEWPGGSGVKYVYIGNLWFGCLKEGVIHVSGNFPYLAGGAEWTEQPPSDQDLLMSNRTNWENKPPKVKTVGDMDTYAFCNDELAGEAGPIPVECEMHGIQWSAPGHDDWLVLECWITSKFNGTLSDCYVSLAYDLDIGGSLDYIDDLVGYDGNEATDLYRNPTEAGVPWNTSAEDHDGIPDENDAVNFSSHPDGGSEVIKAITKDDGTDGWKRMLTYMYDEGEEARDTPGYCGLRVMGWMDDDDKVDTLIEISSQHSWDIMNDPDNDAYKYGYMIDVGTFEEITTAYDWRIDPCFGPFDMKQDDVVHWWTGVLMGGDLYDLRMNSDQLYADFLGPDGLPGTDDDWQVVAPPPSPRLVAVRGDNQVTLRWNPNYAPGMNTETDPDPRSGVRDFDGYIVWRSDVGFDSGWEAILWVDKLSQSNKRNFAWGWRQGKALPNWKRLKERIPEGPPPPGKLPKPGQGQQDPDLRNAPAVAFENIKNSFPTPTRKGGNVRLRKVGDYYEFVDGVDAGGAASGELDNGTRYYYSVVGYDFGEWTGDERTSNLPAQGGKNLNGLSVIPLPTTKNQLDLIKVVPNPYRGSADWEEWTGSGARLGRLYFMNLPEKCTIRIYTIAGELVRTLEHHDVAYGAEPWDLTGEANVQVASGIYIYHIDAPDIGEKIGKFAVLIGQN
jgi:hypothetical protein